MATWTNSTGLLAVLLFASCDGRFLVDGVSWGTSRGAGGAPTPFVDAGGAAGMAGMPSSGTGGVAVPWDGGGGAGSVDAGSDGHAPTCGELEALYVSAVEEDRGCDPMSAEPQCQLRVISALCAKCTVPTYVNSRAASNAARLRWDMVPCPVPTSCNTTCGPTPTSGRCVAGPEQTGRCVDVFP
jgi:hypothetical protein